MTTTERTRIVEEHRNKIDELETALNMRLQPKCIREAVEKELSYLKDNLYRHEMQLAVDASFGG